MTRTSPTITLYIVPHSIAYNNQNAFLQSSQIVRISVHDQTGALINQSAVVDQKNDLVTFTVTSPANQTSTVLFDINHGLICYKPVYQDGCFLRQMEQSDYDNVQSLLHEQTHQVTGGDTSTPENAKFGSYDQVSLPLQALCHDRSVHWTRRAEGPGKQRLVYFCIDICFPSNICVSVCFYYLPE
uniref:BRICHOS domain containing 5 n=1 Tax=Scophthalmus maximus TaxID=52904 RepID=A0A8D3A8L0_SCOMX